MYIRKKKKVCRNKPNLNIIPPQRSTSFMENTRLKSKVIREGDTSVGITSVSMSDSLVFA